MMEMSPLKVQWFYGVHSQSLNMIYSALPWFDGCTRSP